MEKIKSLLNQVAIIRKKNTEILDASGNRFNIFKICGVNHYENTHSSIIAEFLNPNGTHGLKSKFLESFILSLGSHFSIENFNYENAKVRTEHSTEEGRIDILIEDNQNKAIIIENKIYAKDQPEQLKRYNRYAQVYTNGYRIIYLTLWGDDASTQSGEGVSYLPISYKQDIINWLESCVAIASRFPIVRETIIQYINHVKELTNQDMDTKNKEEITQILSNVDNLKAAQTIFQNYQATFDHLVHKHFNPKMEEFAKSKGLEYHYEGSTDQYIGFYLANSNGDKKYWIRFTADSKGYYYGLEINPTNINIKEKERLHQSLTELGVTPIKDTLWWPFYTYIPVLNIDNWENDIIKSENFIDDCKNKIINLLSAINNSEL